MQIPSSSPLLWGMEGGREGGGEMGGRRGGVRAWRVGEEEEIEKRVFLVLFSFLVFKGKEGNGREGKRISVYPLGLLIQ